MRYQVTKHYIGNQDDLAALLNDRPRGYIMHSWAFVPVEISGDTDDIVVWITWREIE